MSTTDYAYFVSLLRAKESDLLSTIRNRDEIVIEAVADEVDSLQQQSTRDIAVRNLDRTLRLLRSVREAFSRFDQHLYATCLRCEESIPIKQVRAASVGIALYGLPGIHRFQTRKL